MRGRTRGSPIRNRATLKAPGSASFREGVPTARPRAGVGGGCGRALVPARLGIRGLSRPRVPESPVGAGSGRRRFRGRPGARASAGLYARRAAGGGAGRSAPGGPSPRPSPPARPSGVGGGGSMACPSGPLRRAPHLPRAERCRRRRRRRSAARAARGSRWRLTRPSPASPPRTRRTTPGTARPGLPGPRPPRPRQHGRSGSGRASPGPGPAPPAPWRPALTRALCVSPPPAARCSSGDSVGRLRRVSESGSARRPGRAPWTPRRPGTGHPSPALRPADPGRPRALFRAPPGDPESAGRSASAHGPAGGGEEMRGSGGIAGVGWAPGTRRRQRQLRSHLRLKLL